MLIHIDNASRKQRENLDIEEPVIAYAFIKYDPVPAHLSHLSGLDPEELEEDPAIRGLSEFAKATAIIDSNDSSQLRSKITAKEGSLEIYMFIAGYLADMFKPEIKAKLKELYHNSKATPIQVRELVKELINEVRNENWALHNSIRGLFGATVKKLGSEGLKGNYPQARFGILKSLERFQDSFTAAKSSSRDLDDRLNSITRALKQLKHMENNVLEPDDKQFLYMYLDLRTRDKKLFIGDKQYDEKMKKIISIKENLQESEKTDY